VIPSWVVGKAEVRDRVCSDYFRLARDSVGILNGASKSQSVPVRSTPLSTSAPRFSVERMVEIASALAGPPPAHEKGIAHRDLQPAT
jgi:hypothetical protein